MKHLQKEKLPIEGNLIQQYLLNEDSDLIKRFKDKYKTAVPSIDEFIEIFDSSDIDVSTHQVDNLYDQLLEQGFDRFVEQSIEEMKKSMTARRANYKTQVLARAKGIITIDKILYNKLHPPQDNLEDTKNMINNPNEYIGTSSRALNAHIGGFTRGYVASVIAKSSHCKSSWVDYNCLYNILADKVTVVKITPEETATTQLRRYLAMICGLPTSAMRNKLVKITDTHLQKVRDKLQGRLTIYDKTLEYKDILELLQSVNCDMLVVDHINAIEYPGTGTWMDRMIGNIPGLINTQKKVAKQKNSVIINLSQVNDKDIQRSDRLIKAPRFWDAYGSSVLFQAAREFLALWYPYRDYEDNPLANYGEKVPTINDVQISIEKSSFSKIGRFWLYYDPEVNRFWDSAQADRKVNKQDYIPPQTKNLFGEDT